MTRSGCFTAYTMAMDRQENPKERKSIEAGRVDDGFGIANPVSKLTSGTSRWDVPLPARRNGRACDGVTARCTNRAERAAPFEVEMSQPVRRLYERRSVAGARIGEPDTVARRAVPDFLPDLASWTAEDPVCATAASTGAAKR